jgi:DNA-damage-inducible protein J
MVYMNTKTATILNFKTDKKLKAEAKKVADGMGVPLSTIMNSFLRQLVREKEITFSAKVYEPTPFLIRALKAADEEFKKGRVKTFSTVDDLKRDLMNT